ncbi:lysozyme inhibitor LprI family protein [Jeongeupia chitinilytica]|uniref:Lysozyme inhibitor LprI-like N-terminal domain-containing protein n=1 Tax=Jeongeupia chitinilytica TaxID=1041641 RepID=A0ABQ3GWW3_9NEIS|nr:lysozyme inhibitor LprI family protein [Jeongeupia chitinilytica]GHD59096.1 hypothetical protein GCM10007350_10000 [Jeongeupia chitinilytica]
MIRYIGAALLLAVGAAHAQPSPPAISECDQRSANQADLSRCLGTLETGATQDRLNAEAAARAAMRRLEETTPDSHALGLFETDVAAYLAYRDAHCDWAGASFHGGSIAGVAMQTCRIDMDRHRADELSRFYVN